MPLRNVFISYHHGKDQWAKDHIVQLNEFYRIYSERSVRDGDIPDYLDHQTIRARIRDNWLRNSTVTILLVGEETRYRKHVDWELKTSMIDGAINKKSGVLVVMLPSTGCETVFASNPEEKSIVYPDIANWHVLETKAAYQQDYPMLPERIYDNLMRAGVKISIVPWKRIENNPDNLRFLIDCAADARFSNDYDTSRDMRMANYNPNPVSTLLGL